MKICSCLLPAALAAAFLFPGAVSANVPEGTAKIMTDAEDVPAITEDYSFSSYSDFSSSDGNAIESNGSSTLYFRDAYNRLISFEMTRQGHTMNLVIRQDMNVVWKGSTQVKNNQFSVSRHASLGHNYFDIQMGEHRYHAEINQHDKWIVTENGSPVENQKPVPVSKPENAAQK